VDDHQTVVKFQNLIGFDRRMRIQEMTNTIGVQSILNDDLGMRRVRAKFVPRIMTENQMENKKRIAAELFERS